MERSVQVGVPFSMTTRGTRCPDTCLVIVHSVAIWVAGNIEDWNSLLDNVLDQTLRVTFMLGPHLFTGQVQCATKMRAFKVLTKQQ